MPGKHYVFPFSIHCMDSHTQGSCNTEASHPSIRIAINKDCRRWAQHCVRMPTFQNNEASSRTHGEVAEFGEVARFDYVHIDLVGFIDRYQSHKGTSTV